MFVVGLGLLGATIIVMLFQNTATAILVGFGFGGSLLALFMRVGGGIFTKAADVGADLVGKVEAGIPEDDPRNAATIADNVGDNVGDCAGMGADLFESYIVILVASLILANTAFGARGQVGLGVLADRAGYRHPGVDHRDLRGPGDAQGPQSAMAPINRGLLTSAVLTIIGVFFVAQFYVHNLKVFWAVVTGVVLGQVASRITEYYTSTETTPVRDIAESARTGPATTVLSGISIGLESSVPAIIAIVLAIVVAIALGNGNIQFELYLVSLAGLGLLSNAGIVVSEDTFGPVSDNAAGIAEMSGEFQGEPERIMVSLDAVGNTTKAVTKGFAIGSAVIAAVALFASYIQTIAENVKLPPGVTTTSNLLFTNVSQTIINVANPKTFLGLLIGGSIAFLFSALAIRAVGRSAGTVVQEVRRQFREHPGIMDRTERPGVRPGHRHLHRRGPAGAGHARPARHPVAGGRRLRHRRPGPRRLPGRHHPDRPADGQLPQQLGWGVGQRQEVHRGRPRGWQGFGGPQGGGDRRHRRRSVQGHGRSSAQPADQGHEPGQPADPAGRDHPGPPHRHPLHHRRGGPG